MSREDWTGEFVELAKGEDAHPESPRTGQILDLIAERNDALAEIRRHRCAPKLVVERSVEDFRRRAIEATKKLQIGGLSRAHVYTMLQNLPSTPHDD